MFNTKRIKALGERINEDFNFIMGRLDRIYERMYKLEEYNRAPKESTALEGYIPCSTCKCLIRKEDAIRGKSEVRSSVYDRDTITLEKKEYIFTPFYCHSKDCKPKKLK